MTEETQQGKTEIGGGGGGGGGGNLNFTEGRMRSTGLERTEMTAVTSPVEG